MNKTYYILCAGSSDRWNNYMGNTKHFAMVNGEPLLNRTIRLISEYDNTSKIVIVAKNNKYLLKGTELFLVPEKDIKPYAIYRFLQISNSWDSDVVLTYGDIWFSEDAIKKISNCNNDIYYFGRKTKSDITGKPYQEPFAIFVEKEKQPFFLEKVKETINNYEHKKPGMVRCTDWELYCTLFNKPYDKFVPPELITSNWIDIDDFTEDFDSAQDYNEWLKRYNKS